MTFSGLSRGLLLASSSPARRMLLERLGLAFEWASPQINEQAVNGESGRALAGRLAQQKAQALAADWPTALIIGSDQVAVLDG